MNGLQQAMRRSLWVNFGAAALLVAASASTVSAADIKVTLSGSQEVPPVTTSAAGTGTITVGADNSISGTVTTTGVNGTAAHIHMAAPGANGPVIIPLVKAGAGSWSVGPGAKLTDAQNDALKAGSLYINVHSEANKGGEIRGQIKP
jgi:CHRD domain-containing protein